MYNLHSSYQHCCTCTLPLPPSLHPLPLSPSLSHSLSLPPPLSLPLSPSPLSLPPSLGTGSPRRQRQRRTLEQQTAISPPQVSGSSQSGLDSVSLQSASSGGSGRDNVEDKGLTNDGNVVTKELNGEVRSMPISHSYTETLNEEVLLLVLQCSCTCTL